MNSSDFSRKYPSAADIAEMKARGYDIRTIEEAERRSRRRPLVEQLCRDIEAAFSGVTLGQGVGLREGQALDDYEDAPTRALCRSKDEKMDWRSIPANLLNGCASSLSFFDPEGMRFHLPAFLVAELRCEYMQGLEFELTYLDEYRRRQFSLLDDNQRRVVRTYLLFLLGDEWKGDFHHRDIREALDEYWTGPVPGEAG